MAHFPLDVHVTGLRRVRCRIQTPDTEPIDQPLIGASHGDPKVVVGSVSTNGVGVHQCQSPRSRLHGTDRRISAPKIPVL